MPKASDKTETLAKENQPGPHNRPKIAGRKAETAGRTANMREMWERPVGV